MHFNIDYWQYALWQSNIYIEYTSSVNCLTCISAACVFLAPARSFADGRREGRVLVEARRFKIGSRYIEITQVCCRLKVVSRFCCFALMKGSLVGETIPGGTSTCIPAVGLRITMAATTIGRSISTSISIRSCWRRFCGLSLEIWFCVDEKILGRCGEHSIALKFQH